MWNLTHFSKGLLGLKLSSSNCLQFVYIFSCLFTNKSSTYGVIMPPKYVRWGFWAVCDDTWEIHSAALFEVNVRAAQDCGFGFCKKKGFLKKKIKKKNMYLWNLEWDTLYAFNRMIEKRIIKVFEISKNSFLLEKAFVFTKNRQRKSIFVWIWNFLNVKCS